MTRESKKWLALGAVATALLYLLFSVGPALPVYDYDPVTSRAAWGWTAVALAIFCALYAWRKRELLQAPGRLIVWKGAHIVAGIFFTVAWGLHADATFGAAPIQWGLAMAVTGLFATGVWGIFMHGTIPGVMNETLVDPVYKDELQDSVDALAGEIRIKLTGADPAFERVYQRHILPFVAVRKPTAELQKTMVRRLFGPGGVGANAAVHDLAPLSAADRDRFYDVAAKALDIVEIRRSQSYQKRMNRWLVWHVGLTVALFALLFFHGLAGFYY
jgi:hypothetical protein